MNHKRNTSSQATLGEGIRAGFPICVGYFPTAMAFGLVCRDIGMNLVESTLFSISNFAGSGQFLAANLIAAHATVIAIFLGVLMINLRYMFMGASIASRLEPDVRGIRRLLVAFGTTDEVFSVSALRPGRLSFPYMLGIEGSAYTGWVSGTAVGFIVGMVLPDALQRAAAVTIYAMFASLLTREVKSNWQALLVAGFAAVVNSLLVCALGMPVGWAFVIAMLSGTLFGAWVMPDTDEEELVESTGVSSAEGGLK